MHFLKNLTEIGEFLHSFFNIEDGRKYTFLTYYALLFQETQLKCEKKRFVQCMEKVL